MSLARTYVQHVQDLARGRPVRVALPNGAIIEAQPSIVYGSGGEELVQLDVQTSTRVGAIEAQIRMTPQTFQASIEKAASMIPRLEAVEARAARRLGR